MKKMRLFALLLMAATLLVACQKDAVKEWEKFSYTIDDIKGSYTYSYVSGAFDDLTENSYCHLCDDAAVTIAPSLLSTSSTEFTINCPKAEFNKTFSGRPTTNENDFLISMSLPAGAVHPSYELTAYVYKNAKGNIRLHGFARHVHHPGTDEEYKVNYYFDVIKK
jgi:hypothetical protein